MSAIISTIALSVTWCFCTACGSLLNACCGNDKASTIPPSVTSGRKRSVLLLFVALAIALVFQYYIGPLIIDSDEYTGWLSERWLDACSEYDDQSALLEECAGNMGVFRVAAATTLFFTLAAIAAVCKPTANREAWPAKYILFVFMCAITILIPSDPWFDSIYLNVARIGGVCFVLLQQIIILDMALDWNDSWVAKADAAEAEEAGTGRKWLGAILVSCAALFTVSIVGLCVMFAKFTGCGTNNAFISITLILIIATTAAQMSGEEGSLLGSATISLWATFLCYSAVAKNPDSECNPAVGEKDGLGIALSLGTTLISMMWTGYSWTAEDKFKRNTDEDNDASEPTIAGNSATPGDASRNRKVTGVVTGNDYGAAGDSEIPRPTAVGELDTEADEAAKNDPRRLSNSWKLNVMLAAISCWMAMSLTSWGEIAAEGNLANPQVGRVGMWIIVGSQWIVLTLYLWTLVAPRIFPDRDFS
mmetsp:Transcript_18885/g.35837  ORF Transcript_18885/g.35837 Transcript_18885/m.35837 type:complete len:476 (-) Transcript_18885:72-1499(-)